MPSLVPRIPTDTVTGSPYLVADLEIGFLRDKFLNVIVKILSPQIWTGV